MNPAWTRAQQEAGMEAAILFDKLTPIGRLRALIASLDIWAAWNLFAALLLLIPIGLLAFTWLSPEWDVWRHMWRTTLFPMIGNTLALAVGVGVGALLLGCGLAWLVVAYRFPGRNWIEWLLLLPMSMPSFVLAYVFMVTFDSAGSVQIWWRATFGAEAYFPNIRSLGGAILVMTLTLFPYVYLLARAAFYEQATNTYEAARILGYSPRKVFFKVVVPMARPSLAAGVALVIMEVLTDIGTVRFLNVRTLTDGVFRIWHGMVNRDAAGELAMLILLFAGTALFVEHRLRRQARHEQVTGQSKQLPPVVLLGARGWAATFISLALLCFAFFLPASQLSVWAWKALTQPQLGLGTYYWGFMRNTLLLASTAAALITGIAITKVFAARVSFSPLARRAAKWATVGYVVPGAVVAIGVMGFLTWLDSLLRPIAARLGFELGLILAGSMVGLLYAYTIRFFSPAYMSVDASLEKISPDIGAAARTLGARPPRILGRVYFPLIRGGILTALLFVLVDIIKELPMTLLLRPFGMDTLAVWLWLEVSESLWEVAALPALTIVLIGLIPIVLLVHSSRRRMPD